MSARTLEHNVIDLCKARYTLCHKVVCSGWMHARGTFSVVRCFVTQSHPAHEIPHDNGNSVIIVVWRCDLGYRLGIWNVIVGPGSIVQREG